MLNAIRLANFRSIADSGDVRLARITLLLGPNSSGKTSILHALRLARQTVDARDQEVPLMLQGDYVDLGTYQDLVFQHDVSRSLEVEYGWSVDQARWMRRFDAPELDLSDVRISGTFAYNRKSWRVYPISQSLMLGSDVAAKRVRLKRGYGLDLFPPNSSDPIHIPQPSQSSKFYDFSGRSIFRSDFFSRLELIPFLEFIAWQLPMEFERQMERVFFLGPVRGDAQRSYAAGAEAPQDVGLRGEATASALWWASRRATDRRRITERVNQWLQRMNVAARVRVRRTQATDFQLLVEDPSTGIESNLMDVGFGVSQVLPVVVLGCLVPHGATVVIEQPEIHLHPAAQLELGSFFAAISTESNVQFILETHSEHLLRRLQTLIADGSLSPADVAIYYVNESPDGASITELPVSRDGSLAAVPEAFFDQAAREAFRRMDALAQ